MRLLVDESLPLRFVSELSGHEVATVREQGWLGMRNGVLLRAAVAAGFDVLLTADRSVEFQQNLREMGIAVVILGGRNRLEDLRQLVPELLRMLREIKRGEVRRISRDGS